MLKFLQAAAVSSFICARPVALALLTATIAATATAAPASPVTHVGVEGRREVASNRLFHVADDAVPLADRLRDGAADMVSTAMSLIGVKYRLGGTSADRGFDCSGFTREVFEASIGLLLPRRAEQQAHAAGLLPVDRDALQPGDLVFFNTLRRTFSHVGIYVGDGKFIHSPSRGGEVRVDDLRFVYWAKRFTGARRAEAMTEFDDSSETDRIGVIPGPPSLAAPIAPLAF